MVKQAQIKRELAFISARQQPGTLPGDYWQRNLRRQKSAGNHRKQPWCGNSLLLVVVRGSLPSKSKSKIGETSVYPQPPDTRVVEGPKGSLLWTPVLPKRPPCLCCCSFPETPSPLQVPGSPQGVEASGEARAPVVAWAPSLLSWSLPSTDLDSVREVFYTWKPIVRRA